MADSQKIETTLGALLDAEPALGRVLATKLDAQVRYHAMKLQRLVAVETKHFTEQQRELIKELGTERQPTGAERAKFGPDPVTEVSASNRAEFGKRVQALLVVAVSIPWGPLTRSMMDAYPDIPGKDLADLGPLYELDPEPTQ